MREGYACPKCNSYAVRRYKWKQNLAGKWKCYGCKAVFDLPIKRTYSRNPTKKRNPNALKIIDYEHLLNMIQNIPSLRDRTLVCILYLTGARVSEIVKRLRAEQLKVEWLKDKPYLIFENVFTLKRKIKWFRNIPVSYNANKYMCDIINLYLESFNPEDILFDINRGRAYTIVRNKTNLFPHYFRTLRTTHLESKGLSSYDLQKIMGWSSTRPADFYVKKDVKDVMLKL